MFLKRLLLIISLALIFLCGSTAQSFSVSPTKYLVTLSPGSSKTIDVVIKNDGTIEERYALSVLGVEQDDQGRSIINNKSTSAALSWIKAEKNDLSVNAGESKNAKFIIDIPKDAQAGSYYLGLAVHPLTDSVDKIGLSGQLVSVLYLKVAGVVSENLSVNYWRASKVVFVSKNKFFLSLQNNGDMEVKMKGEFSLKKPFGAEVYRQDVSLGTMLLAGEEREAVFVPEKMKLGWPGLYHGDLKIIYGQGQQVAVASYNFWYLPWWFLTIVFLIAAAVFFGIKQFVKKKNH